MCRKFAPPGPIMWPTMLGSSEMGEMAEMCGPGSSQLATSKNGGPLEEWGTYGNSQDQSKELLTFLRLYSGSFTSTPSPCQFCWTQSLLILLLGHVWAKNSCTAKLQLQRLSLPIHQPCGQIHGPYVCCQSRSLLIIGHVNCAIRIRLQNVSRSIIVWSWTECWTCFVESKFTCDLRQQLHYKSQIKGILKNIAPCVRFSGIPSNLTFQILMRFGVSCRLAPTWAGTALASARWWVVLPWQHCQR